ALSPIPRRLSPRCLGRFEARSLARHSLCWMLLGIDDAVIRWWRDERVLDGSYCDHRTTGESHQGALRVTHSRRWPYRRTLVTDAVYVLFRACEDRGGGSPAVKE